MSADRNLLFGIVALQNNLISREQLLEAMNAWTLDRQRPLGDILLDRKALTAENHALLNALVNAQIEKHQGDVEKRIQSLEISSSISRTLSFVADEELQLSLADGTVPKPVGDGERSQSAILQWNSRFRILRRHAKGGLGEVFVAEDLELPREVALKKIQAEKADNDSSRGRFVLEAEITGGLEHPNIVPVYGLGTYSDGRPFYAMRFIRGDSLKEAIERFFASSFESISARNLVFRNLLKRFVDVCNAIAYAHSRGIIHRDLKPGNIMLGKFGETLVVDWGLAKSIGSEIRDHKPHEEESTLVPRSGSDYAETLFGTAIGTPAYMAPEQAAGRLDELSPASDVYSLGATLYVLLTGQPPFSGPVNQVIREVANGAFRRPREVNPNLPAALDAIVSRAMALRPDARYPSAMALAQEIERYLADEPVLACRDSLSARSKRWMRRHPGIVSAGAATVLVGLATLGAGLVQVNAEKNRTEQQRLLAVNNEQQAIAARNHAFQALRSMTDDVVERKFAAGQTTRLTDEDRAFLRGVISQFDAFASMQGDDADSRSIRAEGRSRVGLMRLRLGEQKEAEQDFDAALAIHQELVEQFPNRPEFLQDLAKVHGNRGLLMKEIGRLKEAEQDWENTLRIYTQLMEAIPSRPEFRQELARSHNNRGILLRDTGRLKEAEQDWQAALVLQKQLATDFPSKPEFRQELARSHANRGILLKDTGRLEEAGQDYNAALLLQKQLVSEHPGRPEYLQELALSHNKRANLLKDTGRLEEAGQDYNAALLLQKQLVTEFPTRPDFRMHLATTHGNRGLLLKETGRLKEAEQDWEAALAIKKQLVAENPTRPDFRMTLAVSFDNRGNLLRDTGRLKEAEQDWEAAMRIYKQLAAEFPNQPDVRNYLGGTCVNLALLFRERGDWASAKQRLLEGRPHHLAALEANPRNPLYRQFYRNHLNVLTLVLANLLEGGEAVRTAHTQRDLGWDSPADAYNAACILTQCISITAKHDKLDDAKRKEISKFYGDEAMKLLQEAVKRGYKDVPHMKKDKDLDPLRDRKDFQALMAELEKKP